MMTRLSMVGFLLLSLMLAAAPAHATADESPSEPVEPHEWIDPAVQVDELELPDPPPRAQQRRPDEIAGPIEVAHDLGPGMATGLNDRGQVVGHTDGAAWTWRRGRRTSLETLSGLAWPEDINQRGDVVGSATDPATDRRVAVRWRRGRIAALPGLGGDAVATAINDRGDMVGWAEDTGGRQRAVLWRRGRGALVVLPDGGYGGAAFDINHRGHIVGHHKDADGRELAAMWRRHKLVDVAEMVGDPAFERSVAYGIGRRGHVVGVSHDAAAPAFRLERVGGDVHRLFGGYASWAVAVDGAGRSVGWALDEVDGPGPTVWPPGPNPPPILLAGPGDIDSGWVWQTGQAFDINERGLVAGYAYTYKMIDDGGWERAVRDEQRALLWQMP